MANEPHPTSLDLDFRPQATSRIALGALVLVLPFALVHFSQGNPALGVASVAVILALGFNAWHLRRRPGRVPALAPRLTIAALGLSLCAYLMATQGTSGLLWGYPTVLWLYSTLPERHARIANVILLAFALPLIPLVTTPEIALRAAATLTGVSLFSAILLHVITRQQERLRQQLLSDPLTGLLNRHLLTETLERAMARADRDGMPSTLLVMDIDHFKRVNDDFGHAAGDDVLRGVGELLRQRLRASDVAFRLGGEEFLLLLHGADRAGARRLSEALLAELRNAPLLPERRVTASIGTATLDGERDTRSWIARADEALYRAKRTGRDRVVGDPAATLLPIGKLGSPDGPERGPNAATRRAPTEHAPDNPSERGTRRTFTNV